jgi:O-antigen/teichoic acid export membrane protein
LLARGLTVGLGLLTLPLASHYLGKERFGLWLALGSLITWFAVADLGLLNSLVNALAEADSREDRAGARRAVASVFWMLVLVAATAMLAVWFIVPRLPWAAWFNVESGLARVELGPAVTMLLLCCALRLPAGVAGAAYQAFQEGYVFQLWNGASGLLAVAALWGAIRWEAGLPWLCAAFAGAMLAADAASFAYLFGWRRRALAPRPRDFDGALARRLLRLGAQFWIAQASAIVLLQTDLLVVSWLFGASEAAAYGTAQRLFVLLGATHAAFITPYWAAYAEAASRGGRGDADWIARTFRRSIRLSLLGSAAASALLLALMPWLFGWLVPGDVRFDVHLGLALMSVESVNAVTRCIATLLNGLGAIRAQALVGPVCGAANLALSVALGRWLGPAGVAWATAACLLIFWAGVMGRVARRRLDAMR